MSIKLNDIYDFEFSNTSKNISIIREVDNDIQNAKIILKTFEGENALYPTFGTRLQDIIGANVPINFIKYVVKSAILEDSRYINVSNVSVVKNNDHTVDISMEITLVNGDQVITAGVITG